MKCEGAVFKLTRKQADWYEHEKVTAYWVKKCFEHLVKSRKLDGRGIYNLARLTWVTSSPQYGVSDAKWFSTHRPAIYEIFGLNAEEEDEAKDMAAFSKATGVDAKTFNPGPIGIVNFYTAYRNSVPAWAKRNAKELASILSTAARASTNIESFEAFRASLDLPAIPHPAGHNNGYRAAMLLSPVLACLDPRGKTPILNGADHVKELLVDLGIKSRTPIDQFQIMQGMIRPPIKDGFLLDVLGTLARRHLPPIEVEDRGGVEDVDGKEYDSKDEEPGTKKGTPAASAVVHLHNVITNALVKNFKRLGIVVREGAERQARFDLLAENYDGNGRDLLIEVKSGVGPNDIRLAVGQLLDYQRYQKRKLATDLAVGLAERPTETLQRFLKEQGIALIIVDTKTGKVTTVA
jgi:hypothetical protein